MKINLKQEFILLLITLVPLIYLFLVWDQLPQEVAIHYNFKGEADNFSDKNSFILISGIGLFTYFILLAVPFIDPKKQLDSLSKKFFYVKLITLLLVSSLMSFIVYKTIHTETPIQFMMVIMGIFVIALGNYFQTIKPNYFVGIRTPWTLQSEEVWLKTHRSAGKTWMIGGIIIILSYFIFPVRASTIIMLVLIGIISILPIIQSYIFYKRMKS